MTFDENGEFEYLADGETTTATITYDIIDADGAVSNTATVTVTVTGSNDLPEIVPGSEIPDQTGDDADVITPIDVTGAFTDPDTNDVLTYTATGLPAGLTIGQNTGLITGTIDNSASQNGNTGIPTDGVYTVEVTATDPSGETVTDTFTYRVSNPLPIAEDDLLSANEDNPIAGSIFDDNGNGVDNDPDGDDIVVSEVAGDAANVGQPIAGSNGGTFTINDDGSYSFDPGTDFNGLAVGEQASTTIEYQISDGEGGFDTALVTVVVDGVNDIPVVIDPNDPGDPTNPNPADPTSIIPIQPVTDGEDFTTTPLINIDDYIQDPDQTDDPLLVYSTTNPLPAGLTLNPDGTITGTVDPSASQGGPNSDGIYPITVTVEDPNGGSTTVELTIDASNLDPVAVDDASTGTEDEVQTGNVITDPVTGDADTPPDADPITVTEIEGQPVVPGAPTTVNLTNGTLEIDETGAWTFTPNGNANTLDDGETAVETVTYQIDDGQGGTDTATLTIDIIGVNDPIQVIDPNDPETNPQDPQYNPNNPKPIPDPLNLIPDVSYNDGDTITSIPAGDYFGDAEGDTITFSAADLPTGLTIDPNTGEITGTLDPNASQEGNVPGTPGEYLVTITGTDPQGNTAITTVTITATNLPPVAQDDLITAGEDAPTIGSVFDDNGNGIDADTAPDSDPIVVSQVDGDPANIGQPVEGTTGGEFTINSDGTFTFEPGNDFQYLAVGETATTEITYEISDGDGGTDTATVTVTVEGANDAPIPVDPQQPLLTDPTDPNAPPSDPDDPREPPLDPQNYIPVQNVVDGDPATAPLDLTPYFGDPDASDDVTLSLDPNDLPAGLTFDPNTGIISGTPDNSASQGGDPLNPGTYVIEVTATDPSGETFTTNVTYVVENLPPLAQNDALTGDEDTPFTANVFDDNGNGIDEDTAPDSDDIFVSEVGGDPANLGQPVDGSDGGTFTILADGTVDFDPGIDFQDLDVGETRTTSVTYTITDEEGGTSTATVEVTVTGLNDVPVVIDPNDPGDPKDPNSPADPNNVIPDQTGDDGAPLTPLDTSIYFTDVDDEPLVYSLNPDAPSWVSIDPNTGEITGTPPADGSQGGPNNNGEYVLVVTATDPEGESASTEVDLKISNLPPIAVDDASTATEDEVQTGNVLTDPLTGDADTPPDSDPLTVTEIEGQPIVPGTPSVVSLTNGTLEIASDGTWTFTPNGNVNSLDVGETLVETVTYLIDDGQGGTDEADLVITIEGVNDPVVLVDPNDPRTDPTDPRYNPVDPNSPDTPEDLVPPLTGTDDLPFPPYDVTPFFGDAEGDPITYTATGLPKGLTIDPVTGIISGTPANDASVDGPYSVVVIGTDPQGNFVELPITIEIENQPPVLDLEVPDYTVYPGQDLQVPIDDFFSDPDRDTLTFSAEGLPAGFSIDPKTGIISGDADPETVTGGPNGDGIFEVLVTVDDGQGGVVTYIFLIEVVPQPFVGDPNPGVPGIPLPPTGLPQSLPSQMALTDLVSQLGNLGPNTGIFDTMHPIDAVIKQLGDPAVDTGLSGPHYIDAIARHLDDLMARDRAGGDEYGAHGDSTHPYMGGEAYIHVVPGRDCVLFRSMVWQGEVYVEMLDSYGAKSFGKITEFRVTGPGGSALPMWINQRAPNLLLIDRPANVEAIAIEVHTTLRDGSVKTVLLDIDLLTGQLDGQVAASDEALSVGSAAGTFTDRVAELANEPIQKQAALFAALKNHTV